VSRDKLRRRRHSHLDGLAERFGQGALTNSGRISTVDLPIKVACLKTFVMVAAGNTKGGCITVPLTSCLTGLESVV